MKLSFRLTVMTDTVRWNAATDGADNEGKAHSLYASRYLITPTLETNMKLLSSSSQTE